MGAREGAQACDDRAVSQALCPSAPPDSQGGVVFGIVGGSPEAPSVGYLTTSVPVTAELLARTAPVSPTEVFRSAARCAEKACRHFDGDSCTLAARIVASLPVVVERLPRCSIRRTCRWWRQEGQAACLRCPQVVTEGPSLNPLFEAAARPPVD